MKNIPLHGAGNLTIFRPTMSQWQSGWQLLVLTAFLLPTLAAYLAIEWWRGPAAVIGTQTPWDRVIPFYPAWVWIYLLPYLIGPVVIALATPATFQSFVRRAILVATVSLLTFAIIPTKTMRPDSSQLPPSLTNDLYRQMIALDDPPANAAPSLHISITFLLALALMRDFPRWRAITIVSVGLVWLSTLFTHQHHLPDVAAGATLAAVACALPLRRKTRDQKLETGNILASGAGQVSALKKAG